MNRAAATDRPRLRAVLWDLDGTLVDTEPYWIAAEHRLVEAHGGRWSDEHAKNLVGNALPVSANYIREHGPVDLPADRIVELLLDEVTAATTLEVPWRPGARELLAALRAADVVCALVTMSYRRLADAILTRLPADSFATVVTGDQVTDGKPHPGAYLAACSRLGVAPRQTVALEDSPSGVTSARTAGCVTVAIPHHVAFRPLPDVHVVNSLTELTVARLRELVRLR